MSVTDTGISVTETVMSAVQTVKWMTETVTSATDIARLAATLPCQRHFCGKICRLKGGSNGGSFSISPCPAWGYPGSARLWRAVFSVAPKTSSPTFLRRPKI